MSDYSELKDEKERVVPEDKELDLINGFFDKIEKVLIDEVLREDNYD